VTSLLTRKGQKCCKGDNRREEHSHVGEAADEDVAANEGVAAAGDKVAVTLSTKVSISKGFAQLEKSNQTRKNGTKLEHKLIKYLDKFK